MGDDAAVVALQGLPGVVERGFDVLAVGHGVAALLQLLLFAVHEAGIGQFVILELQEIGVAAVLLDVLSQLLQLSKRLLVGGESLLVGRQLFLALSDNVEHAQLEIVLAEQQVLVLRVYVHEPVAQLFEHGQGHGSVVDEGTALALCRQLAAYDGVRGVEVYVVLPEKVLHLVMGEVEVRLYDAAVGPGLHRLGVGPLPQQQPYGSKDDALTRTRLARDDGESAVELHVEHVDERVVLYI